jgi:hypothetical protein
MKEGDTGREVELRGSMVEKKNQRARKNPWACDEKLIEPPDAVEMKAAL